MMIAEIMSKKIIPMKIILVLCVTMCFSLQSCKSDVAFPSLNSLNVTDLNMIDHNGNRFALDDFKETPVILNFVFTGCVVYCPIQTGQLQTLHKRLTEEFGETNFQIVSVTLTPDFDTPESLSFFSKRYGISDKNWKFALADSSTLNQLVEWTGAKVIETSVAGEVDHTTDIYIVDKSSIYSIHDGIPVDGISISQSLRTLHQKSSKA